MPVCFAECNKELTIVKISGSDKIKNHLKNLGFTIGEKIEVMNKVNGNIILKVKGVKLAISDELAMRILI